MTNGDLSGYQEYSIVSVRVTSQKFQKRGAAILEE